MSKKDLQLEIKETPYTVMGLEWKSSLHSPNGSKCNLDPVSQNYTTTTTTPAYFFRFVVELHHPAGDDFF